MFALVLSALLALAFFGPASALVVVRDDLEMRADWDTNKFEPYNTYHARYLALECQNKHNQVDFFKQCCGPLLKGQSISSRPARCTPQYDDCDDDEDDGPFTNPTPSSSHPSTPTPPSAPASGNAQYNYGGFATWYTQDNNLGACGERHSDNDLIAAIDARRYGFTGAHSSLCGKSVYIENAKTGQSVTVRIEDACPTCDNPNSIDLSVAAFKRIATLDEGHVAIRWTFV